MPSGRAPRRINTKGDHVWSHASPAFSDCCVWPQYALSNVLICLASIVHEALTIHVLQIQTCLRVARLADMVYQNRE